MEILTWTVELRLWTYLLMAVVVGGTCFWWGRAERSHRRQMRALAEGSGGYWQGRARVQAPRERWPEPMSPPDLPPRGYAMDATALEADWTSIMPAEPAEDLPVAKYGHRYEVAEDATSERHSEPDPEPEPDPQWTRTLDAAEDFERETSDEVAADDDPEPEPEDSDDEPGNEDPAPPSGLPEDEQADDDQEPDDQPADEPEESTGHRYSWAFLTGASVPSAAGTMPDPRLAKAARMLARRVRLRRLVAWLADLLNAVRSRLARQPGYVARHSPEATGTWPWGEATARMAAEPKSVLLRKWEYAERTGARWALLVPAMREALNPSQRSLTPTLPNVGCTP